MLLADGAPGNPNRWAPEYRCDLCGELTHRFDPRAFLAIRAALVEAGLGDRTQPSWAASAQKPLRAGRS
jgi:hypothetical protein